MQIIIAGAGKVGHTVAETLSDEGHDITVIDQDPNTIQILSNTLDVICVEGSATNPETLLEAGAATADLLLAATELDEVNMICGISARKLGTRHVVSRIRDPEYLKQTNFLRNALGLDVVLNPEYECAMEISRVLRFPSAVRVDAFSKGNVEIIEHRIRENSKLDGVQLKLLPKMFNAKVLVGVVERGGEAVIPNGDFVLRSGDKLSVTGSFSELRRFFISAGEYQKPVRKVMLMGGGRVAAYLARTLIESGISVTIVERSRQRCEQLFELIPKAHIVCGDATRKDVLLESGIQSTDAFVSLTGDDGDNVITALYARSFNVGKVVVKVNKEHFTTILEQSGLDSVVTPKQLVALKLARYVRAMQNSEGGSMETLYRLADGKVEALEFKIDASAAFLNTPLKDLRLKPNILICAIIRNGKSIVPDGSSVILPGDHAIIITAAGRLKDINAIIEDK